MNEYEKVEELSAEELISLIQGSIIISDDMRIVWRKENIIYIATKENFLDTYLNLPNDITTDIFEIWVPIEITNI